MERNRISQQTTEATTVGGVTVEIIDADSALGSFRKACTKALPTMRDAVLAASTANGVRVVRQAADGRWQGWTLRKCIGRCKPRGGEDTMGLWIDAEGDRLFIATR